jgi:hypothetical protein
MRPHLFEFEDQSWFPSSLRHAMTSYLAAAYKITPFPKLWAGRISNILREDCLNEIVDLGSGAGGPIALVTGELKRRGFDITVMLTDLYPDTQCPRRTDPAIRYWPVPVDAAAVPPEFTGIRTLFAAFHHFRPVQARRILQDALQARRSICVFEATSRSPLPIATTLLIPLLVLLLTPRVRPLSWQQFLFTYLVPILPLLIFWDGLVSQLRTYSTAELTEMTSHLPAQDYRWEIGTLHAAGLPVGVPYLIGHASEGYNHTDVSNQQ